MKHNGTIAGFDLSVAKSGFAVAKDCATFKLLNASKIAPPVKLQGPHRILWWRDALTETLTSWNVQFFAVEDYAFSRGNKAHQIGEIGGVLRLVALDLGISFVLVGVSTLKKYVSGNGNAGKDMMLLHAYKKWGFETDDSDISDAYGLVRFAHEYERNTTKSFEKIASKVTFVEPLETTWTTKKRSK